jgi:uncharacterized protein YbbK (DUF523 family)
VFGGLSVPRPEAQRAGGKVLTRDGNDVTAAYVRGAEEALRLARGHDVAFCIMKDGSPSCGGRRVHDGTFTGTKVSGQGLAAEYLRNAGFTVLCEDELDEAEALLG